MFEHNDMNELLTEEQKADGWTYGDMTKEMQVKEFGYVAETMMCFRLAVKYGALECVQYVIDTKSHEIDLDFFDSRGLTCLMWAALNGNAEVVEALLKAEADPSLKDTVEGLTAYELAKRELDEADEKKDDKYEELTPEETKEEVRASPEGPLLMGLTLPYLTPEETKKKYEPVVALLKGK